MTIIVCVDDELGMMFNNRRQSKDSIVRERILQMSVKGSLWMNHYTESQFEDAYADNVNISDKFMGEAEDDDFCFVEDPDDILGYEDSVEMIIMYCWNKSYPCDKVFDFNLDDWVCIQETEFEGTSHDCITEKMFVRC